MESKKDLELESSVFKMNEITKKFKLTPRTIRYYESEGLLGEVTRSIGYTRYFSEEAVNRLKEVIRLKRKGLKIAEIKAMFDEKYPSKKVKQISQLCISDVFLSKDDISKCVQHNILVRESTIKIKKLKLNYLDWKKLSFCEYEQPFDIVSKPVESTPSLHIGLPHFDRWLGNANRSIVKHLFAQINTVKINQNWVDLMIQGACEWCIYPAKILVKDPFINEVDQPYLIKVRYAKEETHHIVFEKDLFDTLERQFKAYSKQRERLLNHVTLSIFPQHPNVKKFNSFIQKMVPHKELLTIEDLSPVYLKSLKDECGILLSFV